jgi:biotin operon repressor
MQKSHEKILSLLSKKSLTREELLEKTGYSYDGIRGRLSEIRKLGYDIQYKDVTEKKYVLVSQPSQYTDAIINWAESKGHINEPLEYEQIKKALNISDNDIHDAMYHVYKKGRLLQLANDKGKILPA